MDKILKEQIVEIVGAELKDSAKVELEEEYTGRERSPKVEARLASADDLFKRTQAKLAKREGEEREPNWAKRAELKRRGMPKETLDKYWRLWCPTPTEHKKYKADHCRCANCQRAAGRSPTSGTVEQNWKEGEEFF